jgi:hypothetical protein
MWSQYLRLWGDSWSRLRAKLEISYAAQPASVSRRWVRSKRTGDVYHRRHGEAYRGVVREAPDSWWGERGWLP